MKNILRVLLVLGICGLVPCSLAADEVLAKSSMVSVTVFPDRATVTREAALELSPGVHSVILEGLPALLFPNSLRVTGKGTAVVKILGIESSSQFLESPFLPEMKKLQAEIEAQEYEISKIRDALDVLDVNENFLKSIAVGSSVRASQEVALGKPDPASWDKTIVFVETKLREVKSARLGQQRILKEQEAKLDALKKKLDSMKPQRGKEAKKVTTLLEAGKAGTFTLSLSYTVPNARWAPLYTLRALPDSSEIEMTMIGNILQRSGENWDDVKALLSTASPAMGTTPPELSPWTLDIYVAPPPAPRADRAKKAMAPREEIAVTGGVVGGVTAAISEEKDLEREAESAVAGIVESGLHVNFDIKRNVQVPSDGTPHKVPIDSQRLKAKFDYFAVPKLREAAFLRGKAKNTLAYPILTGQADLFILQDFVGSAELYFTAPEDEAKLYFGEDSQVGVKRELVKQEKSGPAFLGKKDKMRFVYRITIQNFRKNPVEIEVLDQLPLSRNTQVEVSNVSITPGPSKKDEQGILSWALTLNPQEKKEILIDYTVEFPKDARIIGM